MFTVAIDTCLIQFLNQFYLKTRTFDLDLFNERYEAFEELFYSDRLRFVDTARLYNFDSQQDEIILEDGLSIKRYPPVFDEQTRFLEARMRPLAQLHRSEFVIERRYELPKRVAGSTPLFVSEEITKAMNDSTDLFDAIVQALRIMKSSGVYRDHVVATETITFTPQGGITARSPLYENMVIGNKIELSSEEATDLRVLFKAVRHEENQSFTIASSRLIFGMERRLEEDKLLDYMIGLESLYLPDGNEELSFRLALRVAFIAGDDKAEKKEIFKFIRKIYRLRSKIVHGKAHLLTREDIGKTEEILRYSLQIFLKEPDNFTTDKVSKDGTVTREGVLDNIYFS